MAGLNPGLALNVWSNQIQAGEAIMAYFRAGIQHVILVAQMQSGKTGTAKYVAHALLPQVPAHEIFFICGMNDNDLLNQARREFHGLLPAENILFSKQLQKSNAADTPPPVRCVIIDESHYASNTDSHVDQFLKRIDVRQTFILSVSATPMAELAAAGAQGAAAVTLEPGPGYYGLSDIFANGLIYDSVDLTHFQDQFLDLVAEQCAEQQADGRRCYNIVRLPNQYYYKDLEDELQELDLDLAFINHHSALENDTEADFNQYVVEPPARTTIIWIYGGLRAGKQLQTVHLGFVHDTARSNPDTIAQSLLGRILGYGKERHGVRCYTDRAAATLMLNWVQTGFSQGHIPAGSRGIVRGYTGVPQTWVLHPPLAVPLDARLTAYYRDLKMKHGNRYPFREELLTDIQLSATGDRARLERIFSTYAPGKCGGMMILTEANVARSYRENWGLNYARAVKGEPVGTFLTAAGAYPGHYYVYLDLHRHSSTYGTALVVYKEQGETTGTGIGVGVGVEHVGVVQKSRYNGIMVN
jgi:hypothetical protein